MRRLHRRLRDTDDFRNLLHRFLVVVHEVDDLAMLGRQFTQALPQRCTLVFLRQRDFRIVGLILDRAGGLLVQFRLRPAAQHRERLEAGDAQQPVETAERASNFPAWRQTSRNTR